jgi:hypothetical protein
MNCRAMRPRSSTFSLGSPCRPAFKLFHCIARPAPPRERTLGWRGPASGEPVGRVSTVGMAIWAACRVRKSASLLTACIVFGVAPGDPIFRYGSCFSGASFTNRDTLSIPVCEHPNQPLAGIKGLLDNDDSNWTVPAACPLIGNDLDSGAALRIDTRRKMPTARLTPTSAVRGDVFWRLG